jgi:hypothetical protein
MKTMVRKTRTRRDTPVAHEVSQDWYTHVRFAADGTLVETVPRSRAAGAWPPQVAHREAARARRKPRGVSNGSKHLPSALPRQGSCRLPSSLTVWV